MTLRIGQKTVVVATGQEATRGVRLDVDGSVVQARVTVGRPELTPDRIWHLDAWRAVVPEVKKILRRDEIVDAFGCFMTLVESRQVRILRGAREVAEYIWKTLHPPPTIYPFKPGRDDHEILTDPTPFTVLSLGRLVHWELTNISGRWLEVTQRYGTCIGAGGNYAGIYTKGLQQCVALVYIYYERRVPLNEASRANVVGVAMFHVMSGAIFAEHDPRVLGAPIIDAYPNASIVGVMAQGQGYELPEDSVAQIHQMLPPGSPLYTMDANSFHFAVRLDGTFGVPRQTPDCEFYRPI